MRARLLNIKILGGKSDIKSVYRRVSLSGDTVVKCAMVCNNLALISLFLTFGGSPCPNEWCIVSEICTDLANDIIHCKDWNPVHLYSPHAQKLPPPLYLSDSIPFTQVAELDVDVPMNDIGHVDDFIDDGIVIVPDINNNKNRGLQALLLVINTIF